LREVWRSAGWPFQDLVEAELIAAGLLERVSGERETVRVSDAGVRELALGVQRNRAARDAHEALVGRVAVEMQRAGRLVWRGLSLRAPLDGADGQTRWVMAMPDVFSIRYTTVEDYVEPVVHEIKVRRADLLADVKRPEKGAAYLALSSECWYVLKAGIGGVADVPAAFGVMVCAEGALEVLRPAPKRAARLALGSWMALVRSRREESTDEEAQGLL
jgi:hypothetical protein